VTSARVPSEMASVPSEMVGEVVSAGVGEVVGAGVGVVGEA
jgi:hypothetical protein